MKLQITNRTYLLDTFKNFDEYLILNKGGYKNIKFMFNKLRIYTR